MTTQSPDRIVSKTRSTFLADEQRAPVLTSTPSRSSPYLRALSHFPSRSISAALCSSYSARVASASAIARSRTRISAAIFSSTWSGAGRGGVSVPPHADKNFL